MHEKILQCIEENIKNIKPYPFKSLSSKDESISRMLSQISVFFLWHEWYYLSSVIKNGTKHKKQSKNSDDTSKINNNIYMETNDLIKRTKNVLDVTKLVISQLLGALHQNTDKNPYRLKNWSRKELRLYFVLELAKSNSKHSSRIASLYFGKDDDTSNIDEDLYAPDEVKRCFILNLSRFMVGVVAILQEYVGLEPAYPSPAEDLDSFLYLIDRYAHVELEVDERIDIRGHLGRQIAAEVQHYLARPNYRDHLMHAIDVFLLGLVLLNTEIKWVGSKSGKLVEHLSRLGLEKKTRRVLSHTDEWLRNWAVASLLHDIGYQIGHGDNVSRDPKIWEKYFSLSSKPKYNSLSIQTKSHDCTKKKGLLTDQVQFLNNLIYNINEYSSIDKNIFNEEIPKTDHGILSALRLSQVLFNADSLQTLDKEVSTNINLLITDYQDAIHAIAMHNLHGSQVFLYKNPMSCILRICDELQEWERRRVNIEKVLKGFFLDIQGSPTVTLQTYETLETFKANIEFKTDIKDDDKDSDKNGKENKQTETKPIKWPDYSLTLSGDQPKHCFHFDLQYKNAMEGGFDPIMTLLSKSFNLQHLDLTDKDQGQNDIKLFIDVTIPTPKEYGRTTEYGIYGLFTDEIRELPLLRAFKDDIKTAKLGLYRICENLDKTEQPERFRIHLTRESHPEYHLGWLPVDPGQFFERFQEFKTKILEFR